MPEDDKENRQPMPIQPGESGSAIPIHHTNLGTMMRSGDPAAAIQDQIDRAGSEHKMWNRMLDSTMKLQPAGSQPVPVQAPPQQLEAAAYVTFRKGDVVKHKTKGVRGIITKLNVGVSNGSPMHTVVDKSGRDYKFAAANLVKE